jgi:hypothetical protein
MELLLCVAENPYSTSKGQEVKKSRSKNKYLMSKILKHCILNVFDAEPQKKSPSK